MKRRELIYTIAGTTLAAGAMSKVFAGDEKTEEAATGEDVELLFVQYAESVTLADGTLTFKNVSRDTLYFSDRPHRIVGREKTEKFINIWGEGENSFAEVPPNAVMAVANPKGGAPLDMVVILKNPVYADDTLSYDVEILEGPESGEGGASALFIDAVGLPGVGPTSFRGTARRTARRTTRRMNRRENYREDYYGNDSQANDAYRRGYLDAQNGYRGDGSGMSDAYRQGYEDGRRDYY